MAIYYVVYENGELWLKEADILSTLPITFLKIHQLHIVRDTVLASQYSRKKFPLMDYGEYVDTVVCFLEKLNPKLIIQRLCGEAPPNLLIAPKWGKRSAEILLAIKNELRRRNSWQGKNYK